MGVENPSMFDPFEVLGMQKHFSLNLQDLEKRYFEAQRKTHPDRFSQAEKDEASKKSAAVNQAYLMLKDPLERGMFLLKDSGLDPVTHHSEILMEMMTWRECLEAGEDLKNELREGENKLLQDLEDGFAKKDYEVVRLGLYRLAYVQKLKKMVNHVTPAG